MTTPKRTKTPRLPNGDNGRDANGRFVKGCEGGPGNPYAVRVSALRSALLDAVSSKEVAAMIRAMVGKAIEGDAAAFRVISPYLFGRPIDAEDAAPDAPPKGSLYVEFTRWLRPDGTEITDRDPDYPTELDRSRYDALRQQYENVVQFDARAANA